MEQPAGFNQLGKDEIVCKRHKATYGLKQAPRVCFDKLKPTLISLDYHPAKSDNSLFIKLNKNTITYILIYVDGFIITEDNKREINHVIQHIDKKFSI